MLSAVINYHIPGTIAHLRKLNVYHDYLAFYSCKRYLGCHSIYVMKWVCTHACTRMPLTRTSHACMYATHRPHIQMLLSHLPHARRAVCTPHTCRFQALHPTPTLDDDSSTLHATCTWHARHMLRTQSKFTQDKCCRSLCTSMLHASPRKTAKLPQACRTHASHKLTAHRTPPPLMHTDFILYKQINA